MSRWGEKIPGEQLPLLSAPMPLNSSMLPSIGRDLVTPSVGLFLQNITINADLLRDYQYCIIDGLHNSTTTNSYILCGSLGKISEGNSSR